MASKIMIQGTGSGRGKSLTVAILCRMLSNEGFKVAPFKSVNFTAVTYRDGGLEFGYSQALQAVAARVKPSPLFNPITPKPWVDGTLTVFILGKPVVKGVRLTSDYILTSGRRGEDAVKAFDEEAMEAVVRESLSRLEEEYDVIVIEGSGPIKVRGLGAMSRAVEFANMRVARIANAPVYMIANTPDSARGMLSMLNDEEAGMIKGLIVNPVEAFKITEELGFKVTPELAWGYGRAVFGDLGKPIVAVLPYLRELEGLPELDPVPAAPTVPLDLWDSIVEGLARKLKDYVNLNAIKECAGLK